MSTCSTFSKTSIGFSNVVSVGSTFGKLSLRSMIKSVSKLSLSKSVITLPSVAVARYEYSSRFS